MNFISFSIVNETNVKENFLSEFDFEQELEVTQLSEMEKEKKKKSTPNRFFLFFTF